jgi:hypothetical protein
VETSCVDANLIWVAPSAAIWAGKPAHVKVLLAKMHTFQGDRKKRNARDRSSLSDSCRLCVVVLRCLLVEIYPSRTMGVTHPFRSRGCDGSSTLPCCLVWWIDVIVVRAWPH